jgi:hypothetical protein
MDQLLEIIKIVVSIKDNPLLLVCFLALVSMGVAAWAIYAVILAIKKQEGERS